MPLENPLEPPGGHRVSTISLLGIGIQRTFNLAGWNSCYVMKAMMSTKGRETLLSGELINRYLLSLRILQTVPLSRQCSKGDFPGGKRYWPLNVEFLTANPNLSGWAGRSIQNGMRFRVASTCQSAPIYGLTIRHQPDNQPSFHRHRDGSCRLGAFPAPRLRDRASFHEQGKASRV